MDFHHSEGLEAFSPDGWEQLKRLRSKMNGPTDVTHSLEMRGILSAKQMAAPGVAFGKVSNQRA